MKGIMMLTVVLCFVVSSTGLCRTWYIKSDGTGDAPTIQAGVDSAANGDTVLVASGNYYENVLMKGGITLASVAGWSSTSIEPPARLRPIIKCTDSVPGAVVMGFTLKGGRAPFGGAIYWSAPSVSIVQNRFVDNRCADDGGAIFCSDVDNLSIEENTFDNNFAADWGGAIFCDNCSPTVTGNEFTNCSSRFGGALGCYGSLEIVVSDNAFAGNSCAQQGGAVYCNYGCSGEFEHNSFEGDSTTGTGGALGFFGGTYEARTNLFVENDADYGGAIGIGRGASAVIHGNTFYSNQATLRGSSVSCSDASSVEIYNCIIAHSEDAPAIDCTYHVVARLDCNDLWANDSDYNGCVAGRNDFYEDPLFCDPDAGNYTLQECSPCVDGYGCGQVGAYGVGCGPSKTVVSTWGAIKSMYR
jgi:predicted outer membrane repeat protein